MTGLHKLSAVEAASAIRAGSLTSEQLTAACLDRIAARDLAVQAWAHLIPEVALSQARAADAAKARGGKLGALHGVPVGIKDIVDTLEWPTEQGTAVFKGRKPAQEAEIVTRLKAAGAVILGKTVTTELAFYGPGKTRNPHNSAHTPGGSSSGSAAAVADFQVPLAVGTQTAGSIIRPASYCGVFGFKPTFGAISTKGVLSQSPPLDTTGGYARSAGDMALLIEAMGGAAVDHENPPMGEGSRGAPRFAFVKSPAWETGDKAMQAAMLDLVVKLGGAVEEIDLPMAFDATGGLQRAVQFHDIAASYGPILDQNPGKLSSKLVEVIGEGRTVAASEYAVACARRDGLYAALSDVFTRFDAILTPAASGPAPEGLLSTGSPAFNFLWTYLGCPAVSVPVLDVDGMPLGVQLVGPRDADAGLLAAAQWLAGKVPN
jgi:Asp-tRNA(Asn)/Glu-tRNA(Gln) amidotransferase A subunit family amidase